MQQATNRSAQVVNNKLKVSGRVSRVSSSVTAADPRVGMKTAEFTRADFESALDEVSRPTGRGRLAHMRPNSEEFASRKEEEIELEERPR